MIDGGLLKKISILSCFGLVIIGLLTGCSEPKVGDQFVLKEYVYGGYSMNAYDEAVEEVASYGDDFDPETMGDLVDLSQIDSIESGEEVEIVKVSEKRDMYLLQHIDPDTGMTKEIWITREELDAAR